MTGLVNADGRVRGVELPSETIDADTVVLAAGSWSPEIAAQVGVSIPLQPAKGYSATIDNYEGAPTLPVLVKERRVIVTPLEKRLRFGGTLELTGYDDSIHRARYDAVVRGGREVLKTPPPMENEEAWSGLRPVTPDGLPIIDRARNVDGLIVATGHAMLGFTQSPITGKLVAELANDEAPSVPLHPFSAGSLLNLPLIVFVLAQSISEVRVEGNVRVSDETIRTHAAVDSRGELPGAFRRLWDTGLFEDVRFELDETALRIIVVEKPLLRSIRFEGDRLPEDDLRENLGLRANQPFGEEERLAATELTQELLGGDVVVRVDAAPHSNGWVDVVVRVETSDAPTIERIRFEGNEAVDARELRREMASKEKSWTTWITGSDELDEAKLNEDVTRIESMYHARGYLDAVATKDVSGTTVTIPIYEGRRYFLESVDVEPGPLLTRDGRREVAAPRRRPLRRECGRCARREIGTHVSERRLPRRQRAPRAHDRGSRPRSAEARRRRRVAPPSGNDHVSWERSASRSRSPAVPRSRRIRTVQPGTRRARGLVVDTARDHRGRASGGRLFDEPRPRRRDLLDPRSGSLRVLGGRRRERTPRRIGQRSIHREEPPRPGRRVEARRRRRKPPAKRGCRIPRPVDPRPASLFRGRFRAHGYHVSRRHEPRHARSRGPRWRPAGPATPVRRRVPLRRLHVGLDARGRRPVPDPVSRATFPDPPV